MDEAAIVAVGLAAAEGFSSMDKVVPEDIREASPEAVNDSVESGTILNMEPHLEREVHVSAPETEDTPNIHSSLSNDPPTSVSLPLEPESSLIERELVAERHVETSTATAKSPPADAEVELEQSLTETAPNAQKDIEEVQTQVDDASNIKDEPIPESNVAQHIDAADTELEAPSEEVPAKESHVVQLEPEVDFVASAEEESPAIAQLTSENLSPEIESEGAISQTPVVETIPIPEDATASLANVEDQIISPVDARSEHAAVVETSSTIEPAEVILPPNVEESPETLTSLVEPSYTNSDDKIVSVIFLKFNASLKPKYTI